MDEVVIRAMQKWPEVPAVYGWLSLDRRGRWRMRAGEEASAPFEPVGNAGLRAFIARNYAPDERGCWYFQNGPQRVYVSLEYTPLVYRLEGGILVDQCGRAAGKPAAAWLDEEGSLILEGEPGVGLLDDRDLGALAESLVSGYFVHCGVRLPLGMAASGELEAKYRFVRDPGA